MSGGPPALTAARREEIVPHPLAGVMAQNKPANVKEKTG